MTDQENASDARVWRTLVQASAAYMQAQMDFFSEGIDRVAILKEALTDLRKGRLTAIAMLRLMQPEELGRLLEQLVFLASFSHGAIQAVRDAIARVPREKVLGEIEAIAEPLLNAGTYDEYRRLLELYSLLDSDLALRLARRASMHTDADISEAGRDFLERLRAT